jgi:PhnB protein
MKNVRHHNVPVKGSVVPYLCVDGAIEASKFYERAFTAKVVHIFPADETGRTMHVHLHINGASLMFSDLYPERGAPQARAEGFTLMLQVSDVDASYNQAVGAGCEECLWPADMFWGDRFAQVKDPYGVIWAFVGPKLREKILHPTHGRAALSGQRKLMAKFAAPSTV